MNPNGEYSLQDFSWRKDRQPWSATPYSSYDALPSASTQSVKRKPLSSTPTQSDQISLIQTPIYPDHFHRPTSRAKGFWHSLHAWLPEISAAFLAVASFLSIVVVLRVYRGRGLDDINLPAGLTLNGLIAAIATLERVFLVVPVGSALSQEAWLWLVHNERKPVAHSRLKDVSLSDAASRGAWGSLVVIPYSGRRWLTLSGALITVLSLAIGTFTQQLVVIANLPVSDKASSLNPGNIPRTQYYDNFRGNPAEDAFGPELPMKAAIYNGFMADNVVPIDISCPTGNCTFPPTPSIAVCGDCSSTTNTLSACNSTSCNYTTSIGTIFTLANWTVSDQGTGFQVQSVLEHDNQTADSNLVFADFEMLGAPYQSFSGGTMGSSLSMASTRCRLWMCVNVYNTSVNSGSQTQSVALTYNTIPNTYDNGFSGGDNWTFTLPDQWSSEVYNVSVLGFAALEQELYDMITGYVWLDLEGYKASADTIEAIWSGTNHSQPWIENVALSMTNTIRRLNTASTTRFDGTAYQLGITIKWGWLALPGALTACSIILLIIVMIRTAYSEVGVWKGSPLTVLLFDVDRELKQHFDQVDWNEFSSDIDSHLANKRVTLRKTDRGRFLLKGA